MEKSLMTELVHLGDRNPPSVSRSKTLPITLTSVFSFDDVETLDKVYGGEEEGYVYTRMNNPVYDALKEIMYNIDGGGGCSSLLFWNGSYNNVNSVTGEEWGPHYCCQRIVWGKPSVLKSRVKKV